jgi:hypothetical protein
VTLAARVLALRGVGDEQPWIDRRTPTLGPALFKGLGELPPGGSWEGRGLKYGEGGGLPIATDHACAVDHIGEVWLPMLPKRSGYAEDVDISLCQIFLVRRGSTTIGLFEFLKNLCTKVFQVTNSLVQIMCLALIDIEQQKLKTGIQ